MDTILQSSPKLLLTKSKGAQLTKLWFLGSAHRLMLVNISMKLHEDILNCFQVLKKHCHAMVFKERRETILKLSKQLNLCKTTAKISAKQSSFFVRH